MISNLLLCGFAPLLLGDSPEPPASPTTEQVREAIAHGLDFLLKDQNSEGSWGGAGNAVYTFTGDVWSNPETHRAWKVATTGLCCLALMDAGDVAVYGPALDNGLNYLLANALVKRSNEWDLMNSWAYIYGLQALCAYYEHPRYADPVWRDRIAEIIPRVIGKLADYQAINGGWGYLELDTPKPVRPTGGTSFTTAAAIVALQQARRLGFHVDDAVVDNAVQALERCRLPSGAYTYGIPNIPDPRHSEWIDQIKGSLGRIQVCHAALLMSGREIPADDLRTGLGHFFRDHRFLDIARLRPIPHEAYYLNSGYFYLFGHYYAALVIERLPQAERSTYWPSLQREVMKTQEPDGAMWDYDMHRYHKPYGVAFGLLALSHSLR